jgi:hypothetical protein
MPLFPTKRWLDEYGKLLDESDELKDIMSGGMGPNLDNDVMLVITDLPIEQTTLADLPQETVEEIPADLREGSMDMTLAEVLAEVDVSIRSSLPITLRALIDQYEECVVNGEIYVLIEIRDGDVDLSVIDDPGSYEVDSVFRGPCSTWQQVVDGRPALSAVLTGDMIIESAGLHQFQYATVLQVFGEIATDVETEHIYREPDSSLADFFFDETIRQPVTVQRFLHRQAALTMKTLVPF